MERTADAFNYTNNLNGKAWSPTDLPPALINCLPMDILTMIVVTGYEDGKVEEEDHGAAWRGSGTPNSSEDSGDAEVQPHFPTTFSHVCRRWRTVALNTATVWSNLIIGPGYPIEMSAEWIQRSGRCDLSLYLYAVDAEDIPGFQEALKVIGPNVLRTTSLFLDAFSRDLLMEGLKHFSAYGGHPPLKSLALLAPPTVGMLMSEEFDGGQWEVLMDMTKELDHLHTCGVFFPLESHAYRGLKELILQGLREPCPPGEPLTDILLLAMLRDSQELESLTLSIIEPQYKQELWPQPCTVMLGKLRTFSVQDTPLDFTLFILSALSTPALEELSLENYASESHRTIVQHSELPNALLAFFKNLRPASLKVFSLYGTELGYLDLQLARILRYTPELEGLCVGERRVVSPSGRHLLQDLLDPDRLVPKLERLWLRGCGVSLTPLKELVLQRNSLDASWPIRQLVIEGCQLHGLVSTTLPTLKEKVDELVWRSNLVISFY